MGNKKPIFCLQISRELLKEIEQVAKLKEWSRSKVVRKAVEAYIRALKKAYMRGEENE